MQKLRLRVLKKIGKGKHSEVFLALDLKSCFLIAIKRINKEEIIKQDMEEQFSEELKVHFQLKHPNIVQLYGLFDDSVFFYLIMEYAPDGQLKEFIEKQKNVFNELQAGYFLKQLLDSIIYLHQKNIMHRDIKLENLLISNEILKLADFGYSRYLIDRQKTRKTFCGTLDYLSPFILNEKEYDQQVDIWALGVVLYTLLQGITPFYENSFNGTFNNIQKGSFSFQKYISLECKEFIKMLLNPQLKITVEECAENKWVLDMVREYDKLNQFFLSEEDLQIIY
ncbi:hypothetical protein IMG5_150230 [Ichthyophthirius multifiliis]|uniref:Protein kinase domain-containing protein n=1 Tax=Ichthyophthirius multifiliis TaxID=5932 RepID=G0QYJ8_ICHMU|nr:hypothetical protein IMG5_150230 [Ichthyophthirius multifiliis]EGR29705.1 hypothetical protein IMG5_150230 [Ichthyophthirius multifiliis]|eukprot:XP_004030941.1 hypothetical protein IMG5_150230 [Ichthyophthirius multifiliis]